MYRMIAIATSAIALIIAMVCVLFFANNAEASDVYDPSNIEFDSVAEAEYIPEPEVAEINEPEPTPLPETGEIEEIVKPEPEPEELVDADEDETACENEPEAVDEADEVSEVNPNGTDPKNFKRDGEVYYNELRFTWYSERVKPGGGLTSLNSNGRHVDDNGFVCDGDGYIALASNDYAKGSVIETPFGTGKVYDCGCASGTVDVYVSW